MVIVHFEVHGAAQLPDMLCYPALYLLDMPPLPSYVVMSGCTSIFPYCR